MASLSIRQVDEETVAAIRRRAARRGVSMEEEIRHLLREAAKPKKGLGALALDVFKPGVDLDEPFEPPPREHADPLALG